MMDAVNTPGTQGTFEDAFGRQTGRQQTYQRQHKYEGQRNSFLFSMLVLSSYIIKADGKVMHSEMEMVRQMLRQNFGEQAVIQGNDILKKLFDEQKRVGMTNFRQTVADCCQQIARNMNYSQRLQLFHFLVGIANADGEVSKTEKSVLEAVGAAIRLNKADITSVIAMFYKDTDSAYAVLEISPSATDDEVKSAYRRMAMKNHPDRVSTLGPDVQKAAAERFQQISEAYETIKKQRGMK